MRQRKAERHLPANFRSTGRLARCSQYELETYLMQTYADETSLLLDTPVH